LKTKTTLLTILVCPILIYGQIWDYPVKPGTEEWKIFKSNKEMIDACQIPEKILFSLSTNDLTELCLHYPLLYDTFAFNDLNEGFNKLFNDFNGIRELYKRKDTPKELLKRYNSKVHNLSYLDLNASDSQKGLFIISISAIEVLLSNYNIQDNMETTSKEILKSLVFGYENKSIYNDYFKGLGFRTNFYSRAQVITRMNSPMIQKLSQEDKNSVLTSGMADSHSINVINELSYQLIK